MKWVKESCSSRFLNISSDYKNHLELNIITCSVTIHENKDGTSTRIFLLGGI